LGFFCEKEKKIALRRHPAPKKQPKKLTGPEAGAPRDPSVGPASLRPHLEFRRNVNVADALPVNQLIIGLQAESANPRPMTTIGGRQNKK
jgi:hypothetical protein